MCVCTCMCKYARAHACICELRFINNVYTNHSFIGTDVGNCVRQRCQNGGNCVPDLMGVYHCICAPGFTGFLCETGMLSHCDVDMILSINLNVILPGFS